MITTTFITTFEQDNLLDEIDYINNQIDYEYENIGEDYAKIRIIDANTGVFIEYL